MKQAIERFFCRHPLLYLRVLRAVGSGSLEKRSFLALVRDGDVVCDIGANRGYFTRLFSRIVGGNGEVYAFEPGSWAFTRLSATMGTGGVPANFKLHHLALSDTSGIAMLNLPERWPSCSW